jgi:hypothetical protein
MSRGDGEGSGYVMARYSIENRKENKHTLVHNFILTFFCCSLLVRILNTRAITFAKATSMCFPVYPASNSSYRR